MKSWTYFGPTYHGHPYLDGRGVFVGGHPLDVPAIPPTTPPDVIGNPYPQLRSKKKGKRA